MNLSDLHNPDKITAITLNNGDGMVLGKNQGWQETKGRYELWWDDNGLLRLVNRWNKKSVLWVTTE